MVHTVERPPGEPPLVELSDLGELPAVYGPLFGRDHDLDRAAGLIAAGRRPVLTVVGTGGVGKTRLAVALGGRLGRDFADGVRFVPLAGERAASDAATRVGQALGASTGGPEQIRLWLESRDALLILDNLEQIPGAGALVAGIVPRTGGSRLVVTSRGPLHVAAEQVLRLEPLGFQPIPHDGGEGRGPAVALFLDTATAADAGYAPDADELDRIAELCRRLDGLPLAIRLAAQRRRLLGVPEMLRRVDRDPTLLAGASPDLEERQRTIERSIWWSLDLLTDEERADAHLLSLAPAGWSDPALAAVEPPVPLSTLERLLNLGLVGRVGDRLAMLQTVRDVVAGSRADTERDRNRGRLIDAVTRDAARVQGLGAGPAGLAEDANLREVVNLLAGRGDADRLLAFAVATDAYWIEAGTAGAVAGSIRWALDRTTLPRVSDQLRALQLGSVASTLGGETEDGLALAHRMVSIADERGSAQERVRALNILGGAYLMAHQPELAYATFRSALPLEEHGADVTKIFINLAGVAVTLERDDEAVELLETARARAAETTGIAGHPVPLMHLAELAIRAGELATARRHLLDSLARSVEINQRVWQLAAAFLTGGLAQSSGDLDAAAAIVARTEAVLDRERLDLGILVDAQGMARLEALRAQIGPGRWRELRRADAEAGLAGLVAAALAWLSRPVETEAETEAGPLTTREREIARLIAAGRSNQEIADHLFLSRRTVQTHVANMLRKLELPSRSALAAWEASAARART